MFLTLDCVLAETGLTFPGLTMKMSVKGEKEKKLRPLLPPDKKERKKGIDKSSLDLT